MTTGVDRRLHISSTVGLELTGEFEKVRERFSDLLIL